MTRRGRLRMKVLAGVGAMLMASAPLHIAAAQAPREDAKADAIGREARKAGASGEFAKAAELFRQQIALAPTDFQARYNLSRVEAAQGHADVAMTELRGAIESGYDDLGRLKRDSMMKPVRELPQFKALEDSWGEVLDAQRDRNIEESKRFAPPGSAITRDDKLRLVFISSWDAKVLGDAKAELTRISAWAEKAVFPGLMDAAATDPWVVVVLPDKDGFERWQSWYFGGKPMASGSIAAIGGAYDHDTKRLVARDLGSTLRHEFFHVLHWRMCARVGQIHPVWLQEGLCALVEDYDMNGGKLVPAPSYRTNTAKRLAKIGSLATIGGLTSMDRERFLGTRPMASYAQARTLFLFLNEKDRLRSWYAAFVEAFGARPLDGAGAATAAFENSFGTSMAEVEKSYRQFVRDLPEVAEQIASGSASLGVEVEPGTGDGPVIVAMKRTDGVGLRVGDVILSIDDKPTHDTPELVRVLGGTLQGMAGGYRPGDTALVRVRRGADTLEIPVKLVVR